uniref:HEAT repeat-containing protein 5B isoform X2 n=1 Tax=Rhizophora mucronata TaxID=61149 RepID=A0A2P2MKT4_RHIMU
MGSDLKVELDLLHGQATVLASLVSFSPKLPLGYPARLPKSVLELSRKMLTESSRNPMAATVEKEAGWLLLSSLLSAMTKQELEDQVFDILSLWAALFSGNPEQEIKQIGDLTSKIRIWSAAVDALTAFIRCFIVPNALNSGILLQPVMVYLSSALSYILLLQSKELPNAKSAADIFIIKTLMAYQSLPDTMAYKFEHPQIIKLCTIPYRDASKCEESSCLRSLLNKRDAWLGPLVPGRDWFEDELRAFQGGKDGLVPCVWENEPSSFPQPETINKTLVNQMLLCFGIMFASQDSGGMLSLLGMMDQCLKAGKKQMWHAASVTNICVGLLAGLKALIALRPQPIGLEILNSAQAIFQGILAEGDICASQRRASSEGLGLLARLGNDIFTARMARSLIGELAGATDSSYAGSVAFALGCIHRSAGGMALSSLVPATVSSVSSLAKSTISGLQIWALHGLLLTIEAAGFSYVSHVQATLSLALDILLSEESGLVDLQQGVGRLINAIVAVLGPELAPGSIFFSRCKSVIAEISSWQETATLLESVRFTQQLVLFAPQAVSVHTHLQTLLSTLSSRQPTLRHIAVSTLRHLIEKDPVSIISEQIEENLFHMLDDETDSEIGNMVRATIMRLLLASSPSCPSHWILICRKMVLATSTRRDAQTNKGTGIDPGDDSRLDFGDDENMVSSSNDVPVQGYALEASNSNPNRDKHLRYRTRVFAAECLSHLPTAVGKNSAHFDLSLARGQPANGQNSGDWLVIHLQELISLAYQISTIQFENMRPIGVGLLSTIVDKFVATPDPELPGHFLLEQFQAQLVSAVRTALDSYSGPTLLEAGLQLATKIMTSGILGGDQVAVKRIFSLISRPLDDFNDIYYPSFAEWVSCKIKLRLLAAHASLKCYTFAFLRRHHTGVPDEYLALLPLFSKSSSILGKYWIQVLKDYSHVCLFLNLKKNWNPFLDGIQSPLVSSKLQHTLEEAWPVILQAVALDSVPAKFDENSEKIAEDTLRNNLISGYRMVELELEDYHFLWGFALLVLFQQQHPVPSGQIIGLSSAKIRYGGDSPIEEINHTDLKLYEIVLPVFQFLSTGRFFSAKFLSVDICQELLQVFLYSMCSDNSWNSLAISVLSQIVQNCPEDFLETENFVYLAVELLLAYIFNVFQSADMTDHPSWEELISLLFIALKKLVSRFETKKQLKSVVSAFLLIGYKGIREASTESCFLTLNDIVNSASPFLMKFLDDSSKHGDDLQLRVIIGTCLNVIADLAKDCVKGIHLLENTRSDLCKLLKLKLSFSLEQIVSFAKLANDIGCPGETKGNYPIFFATFKYCSNYFQMVLNDQSLQVQAIGLQVLKTAVQTSANTEDIPFLISFSGEIATDILTLIQTVLQKPVSKESGIIIGECLRFLVLLQTLSKASECQQGFMDLLLKAIIMVISASEDKSTKEFNDIRTTAMKLVSHLAQIPSSAALFKDVLLSMPAAHRQQLQSVIRASVAQDHSAMQMKSTIPLEIKIPVLKASQPSASSILPMEEGKDKNTQQSASSAPLDQDVIEDDQEEEDDWDAFQSFPATTKAAGTKLEGESAAEEHSLAEKSVLEMKARSDKLSIFQSSSGHNDSCDAVRQRPDEEEARRGSPAYASKCKVNIDIGDSEPCQNKHQDLEDEAASSQGNMRIPSDLEVFEDTRGSSQRNVVKEYEQSKESLGKNIVALEDSELCKLNVALDHKQQQEHSNENDLPASSGALPPEKFSRYETQSEDNNKANPEDHGEVKDAADKTRDKIKSYN